MKKLKFYEMHVLMIWLFHCPMFVGCTYKTMYIVKSTEFAKGVFKSHGFLANYKNKPVVKNIFNIIGKNNKKKMLDD